MKFFCYGEPSRVSKPELAAMRPFLEYDQGIPDWVDIFVGRCIDVQESDKGKIDMGGMVTLLVMYLGIDIPDNVPKLVTNTTIFYDKPTLRRVRFIQYRQPYTCSLIIPNGRIVSLPPISETVFDVRDDDTTEMLCNRTLTYSHQHPVEQAPVTAGVHIDLDGGMRMKRRKTMFPLRNKCSGTLVSMLIPTPVSITNSIRGSPIWRTGLERWRVK